MAFTNQFAQQTQQLNASVTQLGTSAHVTGQEMHDLAGSVFSYGKAIIAVGAGHALQALFSWAVKHAWEQRKALETAKQQHALAKSQLAQAREQYKAAQMSTQTTAAELKLLHDSVREHSKIARAANDEKKFRVGLSTLIKEHWQGAVKTALIVGALAKSWSLATERAQAYNQALIQANTSYSQRYGLVNEILAVQTTLGASTETMAEAARELVDHGQDMLPTFSANLKVVAMMRDGLGVSARTGSELVVIFGRQLRVEASRVGDAIANIAANTALAADEAARYAIEIGKAMRTMGPGLKTDALGVVDVVEAIAGKVKELGGSSESVVRMYRAMAGGGDQGFVMRALAGIQPSALGSREGTGAGMQGLSDFLNARLTAQEGTPAYLVQKEQFASLLNISSDELTDFMLAMKDFNGAMSQLNANRESNKLLVAYRHQMATTGKAVEQLTTALGSLLASAMMPFLRLITPAIQGLAAFVRGVASFKPLVWALSVAVPVAAVAATVSMIRLGRAMWALAVNSRYVEAAMLSKGLPSLKSITTFLMTLPNIARTAGIGQAGRVAFGRVAATGLGRAGLYGAALAAGAGIGYVVNKLMDKVPSKMEWMLWLNPLGQLRKLSEYVGLIWTKLFGGGAMRITPTTDLERKNAVALSQDAATALVAVAKTGTGQADFNAKMQQAILSGATKNVSEDKMRQYIANRAAEIQTTEVAKDLLKRVTTKSDEERTRDERSLREMDQLDVLQEQLKKTGRIEEASKDSADAARQALRAQEAMRNAMLWNFVPTVDSISNKNAYQTPLMQMIP